MILIWGGWSVVVEMTMLMMRQREWRVMSRSLLLKVLFLCTEKHGTSASTVGPIMSSGPRHLVGENRDAI